MVLADGVDRVDDNVRFPQGVVNHQEVQMQLLADRPRGRQRTNAPCLWSALLVADFTTKFSSRLCSRDQQSPGQSSSRSMASSLMDALHRGLHRSRDLAIIGGAEVVIEVAVVLARAVQGLALHKDVAVEVNCSSTATDLHAIMGLDASLGSHRLEVKLVLEGLDQGGGKLPRVVARCRRDLGPDEVDRPST